MLASRVHKRESQVCILVEASTESEWVARCLEELGHEVVVADPNFALMYASAQSAGEDGQARCAHPGRGVQTGSVQTGAPHLGVALLSDLHVGSPHVGLEKLREVVRRANEARPDLVLIAGDLVTEEVPNVPGVRFVPPEGRR
jgi:hypothetical protein